MQLSKEQMKRNIEDLLSKIGNNLNDIKSKRYALHFKRKQNKKIMLKTLFQKMESIGIDPGNIDHVKKFLDTLKSTNPDGHELFEKAMNHLLKEEKPPKINNDDSDF